MKVFLTGATGYIGSAVARALLGADHSVVGVARTAEAERTLEQRGIVPFPADLKSPETLAAGCSSADAVIHTATTNDGRLDSAAIWAILETLRGTGKPLLYTSGIWVLGNTGDRVAEENSPLAPPVLTGWRPAVEKLVLDAASDRVRGIVIRPGVVYGKGAGLPATFVKSAQESGAARYIGTGENHWPLIHCDDLADLYLRALDRAEPGALFHAVDGSALCVKEIAEAASFGAGAGGRTESWPVEQASQILGGALVEALLLDQIVSASRARRVLGWRPRLASALLDLRSGSYSSTAGRS